jgi:hypothetical protein
LILGSISVASAASGKVRLTDIADSNNENAIQVTYDLGIVTGTPEGAYEPEKAVNRAEFAALITRALAIPDSALASYSTTTFKDTSGYGWAVPYLAILQQRGIMKGDGYGNAMPGRTITPNEAVTMVLRAIGYTDNASVLVGQWPANYVALGQSQNLYEKVANDTEMNKASAAQMVYNVLTAQLVQVDANSTVKYLYDSDSNAEQSLLTTSLNCYREPAVGKKIVGYSDAETSKIDLLPNVGAYGVLYRSNADGEVVALTRIETSFLTGKFTYTAAHEIDKFEAVDGTRYNLSADAKTVVDRVTSRNVYTSSAGVGVYETFMNGDDYGLSNTGVGARNVSDYTGEYYANVNTNDKNAAKLIISARISGVTILDLRSVAVWDADYAGRGDSFLYESGQIDGKKFNGHDFPLDTSNEVDNYGYVLAGIDSLDDLAVDNVVYIYKNADKKIKRIEVGTDTQSGSITNINTAAAKRTIGGTVLNDSPYHHTATWADLGTINNEGTALLDIYGRTYAFRLGEASKGNYAVLIAGQDYFSDLQVKIFEKTGNEAVYGVRTNISANGVAPNYTGIKDDKSTVTTTDDSYTNFGELFEYKLSGGKLSYAVPGGHAWTSASNGVYGKVNPAGTIINIEGLGDRLIDSSVLVYIADFPTSVTNHTQFHRATISIGSIKDLQDGDIKNEFNYFLDPATSRVKALLVNSDDAGTQNVFVMINNITEGSDGAGGAIDVVGGLSLADGGGAAAKTWSYADSNLRGNLGLTPTATNAMRGRYDRMVKFRIDEAGVLKAAVDLETNSVYASATDTTGAKNNPTIWNAYYGGFNPGSGGTFSITLTPGAIGAPFTQANDTTTGLRTNLTITSTTYVTFEANAVIYKKEGSSWAAYKANNEAIFKADVDANGNFNGNYTFLKSDPDKKAYDVIVKN